MTDDPRTITAMIGDGWTMTLANMEHKASPEAVVKAFKAAGRALTDHRYKHYLFVLAIHSRDDKMIRFEHTTVVADSKEDAYHQGGQWASKTGIVPVAVGELANDYVIELEG